MKGPIVDVQFLIIIYSISTDIHIYCFKVPLLKMVILHKDVIEKFQALERDFFLELAWILEAMQMYN